MTTTSPLKRTTLSAPRDVLATLEEEARRREVPLNTVLAEVVEEKATRLRDARRPRLGLGRSSDGATAAAVTANPVARPPR